MSTHSGGARLGVDLGTTWTAAAITDRGGTRPLMLGDSGPAMPSVVAFEKETVLVGDAAERRLLADPSSGVREPKRRLGDTTPYVVGGTPYGADTLMGHLLGHVVVAATAELGAAPTSVVLTHPANWGEYKLDLLREAARIADVGNIELSSEPEAAARHYVGLGRVNAGDAVAVYDFGGGTFDVAVVRCGDTTEVLGTPEGLERLGGLDLDQAVLAHVDTALDGQLSELDTSDPAVRQGVEQLRVDCTRAKEALSVDSEAVVAVRLPGLVTEIRMTRDEFEGAIRARLADTLTSLDRALESAGVKADELAGLLMVGGSSRIPLVTELVSQHTDRPVLTDADAKLVVALGASGAAVAGGDAPPIISGQETDMAEQDTSDPDTEGQTEQGAAKSPTKKVKKVAAKGAATKKAAAKSGQDKAEKKDKKGRISAKGAAAGVAGVAAAAAVVGGGVAAADAFTGGGGDEGLDEDALPPPEDSMDAFDDAAPASAGAGGGGSAGGGGGRSGGSGGGGSAGGGQRSGGGGGSAGGGVAGRAAAQSSRADDGPGSAPGAAGSSATAPPPDRGGSTDTADTYGQNPEIDMVRAELRDRLADWKPPEGSDPAEVAELRAELDGLLDRFQPLPGQSVDDAIDALRADFDDQVKDFTQDQKIDALIDEREREQAEEKALADGVDDARNTLEERLAAWEPPAGTDPAAAAELKEELAEILTNYVPVPGSTVDQAIAELQQRFDGEVTDFAQDQKIDALVGLESSTEAAPPDPPMDEPDFMTGPPASREGRVGGLTDAFDDMVATVDGEPSPDRPDVGMIADPIRAEYATADSDTAAGSVDSTDGIEPDRAYAETDDLLGDDVLGDDVLGGDLVTADVAPADVAPLDLSVDDAPPSDPDFDPRLTTTADDLLGNDEFDLGDAVDEPDPLLQPEFDTIGTDVDGAEESATPAERVHEPVDEPVDDQPDEPTFT